MSKVLMAMSGGVDSSVAAWLLLKAGFEVEGFTMTLEQPEAQTPDTADWGYSFKQAVADAASLCAHYGIPHHVVNLRQAFSDLVLAPFLQTYAQGRTPCPCATCNRFLKFGSFWEIAERYGCRYLATGHYVRGGAFDFSSNISSSIVHLSKPSALLSRGMDPSKDQSYFLAGVGAAQLSRAIFPLGSLTKKAVREIAQALSLATASKRDSQDLCFIPNGQTAAFLNAHISSQPGPITNLQGHVLGKHSGLHRYTLGQRHGLGICSDRPLFVLQLDVASNSLVVGEASELIKSQMLVSDLNWLVPLAELAKHGLAVTAQGNELTTAVQYRSTHRAQPATITWSNVSSSSSSSSSSSIDPTAVLVSFHQGQRALTPGQRAVFYSDDQVLGAGTIEAIIA